MCPWPSPMPSTSVLLGLTSSCARSLVDVEYDLLPPGDGDFASSRMTFGAFSCAFSSRLRTCKCLSQELTPDLRSLYFLDRSALVKLWPFLSFHFRQGCCFFAHMWKLLLIGSRAALFSCRQGLFVGCDSSLRMEADTKWYLWKKGTVASAL